MKVSRFSERQIAVLLKQVDDGVSIGEICRKTGISQATCSFGWLDARPEQDTS
jgi:putative transposase